MTAETPRIFDRALYLKRQANANPELKLELHTYVKRDLEDRLSVLVRQFANGLLIGDPFFRASLQASGKFSAVSHMDVPRDDALHLNHAEYDAIVSILDLQSVNDVPGYLAQLSRALRPDGLLMLAFFAGDTLNELRQAVLATESEHMGGVTLRVSPMIGIRELGGLLQRASLALPVADLDRQTIRYQDPLRLLQDIKELGFANTLYGRSRNIVTRGFITQIAKTYCNQSADSDGRIRATVEIAWANAWKPHPSQPKPLQPGSAKTRLADALKVKESKL
jgi:SAM-dependent methyltransferase